MDDFRRRVHPQREPVAGAVAHDQRTAGSLIESGPVAEHLRTGAEFSRQHDLTAVRVTGQRQGNPRFRRPLERVGMVRQQDRKRRRIA